MICREASSSEVFRRVVTVNRSYDADLKTFSVHVVVGRGKYFIFALELIDLLFQKVEIGPAWPLGAFGDPPRAQVAEPIKQKFHMFRNRAVAEQIRMGDGPSE